MICSYSFFFFVEKKSSQLNFIKFNVIEKGLHPLTYETMYCTYEMFPKLFFFSSIDVFGVYFNMKFFSSNPIYKKEKIITIIMNKKYIILFGF